MCSPPPTIQSGGLRRHQQQVQDMIQTGSYLVHFGVYAKKGTTFGPFCLGPCQKVRFQVRFRISFWSKPPKSWKPLNGVPGRRSWTDLPNHWFGGKIVYQLFPTFWNKVKLDMVNLVHCRRKSGTTFSQVTSGNDPFYHIFFPSGPVLRNLESLEVTMVLFKNHNRNKCNGLFWRLNGANPITRARVYL